MCRGFCVEFDPDRGPRQRIEFVPQVQDDSWLRIVSQWNGEQWYETEKEPCENVIALDAAGVFEQ